MSYKNPELRDITEISNEIQLHEQEGKKFTIITSFVYGRMTVRFCAYRGKLCVCALHDINDAWKIYEGIDVTKTQYTNPQLN